MRAPIMKDRFLACCKMAAIMGCSKSTTENITKTILHAVCQVNMSATPLNKEFCSCADVCKHWKWDTKTILYSCHISLHVTKHGCITLKPGFHLNVNETQTRHAKMKPPVKVDVLPRWGKQHSPVRWMFGKQPNVKNIQSGPQNNFLHLPQKILLFPKKLFNSKIFSIEFHLW